MEKTKPTNTKYKISIKTIVENLRKLDELDQNKWENLKKENRTKLFWLSFIHGSLGLVMYAKDGWGGVIIVLACYLCLVWWFHSKTGMPMLVSLYSTGRRVFAEVLYGEYSRDYNVPNKYIYRYLYADSLGLTHENLFIPSNYIMAEVQQPKAGDRIEILYLEDAPEITMPYMEYLNEKYNLRMESKNE
jgi:hypothetical protein